jgi:hypothetical protein
MLRTAKGTPSLHAEQAPERGHHRVWADVTEPGVQRGGVGAVGGDPAALPRPDLAGARKPRPAGQRLQHPLLRVADHRGPDARPQSRRRRGGFADIELHETLTAGWPSCPGGSGASCGCASTVAPSTCAGLRGCSLRTQLDRIGALASPAGASVEHRITVLTLRCIAARVRFLVNQTDELDPVRLALVTQHPAGPALPAEPGVGPVTAAQLLVSWSHRGRSATKPPSSPSPAPPRWKPAAHELLPIMPPRAQFMWVAGSGPYRRPVGASCRLSSSSTMPGCTTQVRAAGSTDSSQLQT